MKIRTPAIQSINQSIKSNIFKVPLKQKFAEVPPVSRLAQREEPRLNAQYELTANVSIANRLHIRRCSPLSPASCVVTALKSTQVIDRTWSSDVIIPFVMWGKNKAINFNVFSHYATMPECFRRRDRKTGRTATTILHLGFARGVWTCHKNELYDLTTPCPR